MNRMRNVDVERRVEATAETWAELGYFRVTKA